MGLRGLTGYVGLSGLIGERGPQGEPNTEYAIVKGPQGPKGQKGICVRREKRFASFLVRHFLEFSTFHHRGKSEAYYLAPRPKHFAFCDT